MYHLRAFQLRDMTACAAALRRLGREATSLDDAARRITHYLYAAFSLPHSKEPACVLVRLFITTPYHRLAPELQTLADRRLGAPPADPAIPCLRLAASTGLFPGWNDPAQSSRYRVIPLAHPDELTRLPMFSQLLRQFGMSFPTADQPSVLLDTQEQSFNVFHVPHAEGSPYVPAQQEFVRTYGVRSVVGFGAPLPNGEMFAVVLFARDLISDGTAQLFRPMALSAQIALAPFVPSSESIKPSLSNSPPASTQPPFDAAPVAHLQQRIAMLEQLLTVHEQTAALQGDRLDLVIEGAGVATWDWEIATGRMTTNRRWAELTEQHVDEVIPHVDQWDGAIHPDDRPHVQAAMAAHLRGETPLFSAEYRLRLPSGGDRWLFDRGRLLQRAADGTPLRAAGIRLDISSRKRLEAEQRAAERRLQQREQDLQQAQALSHVGSWEWDIETGALQWSDELYRIFGLSPNGRPLTFDDGLKYLAPPDVPYVQAALDAALRDAAPYNLVCRAVRPTGEIRYLDCRGTVQCAADGRSVRMVGTARDVTDSTLKEQALRESEARYRALVELSPNAVFVECHDRIAFVNHACVALLGALSPTQLIGRSLTDFLHPDSLVPSRRLPDAEPDSSGLEPRVEARLIRLDGRDIVVDITAAPILFEGRAARQIVAADVTTRKQLEHALIGMNRQLTAILEAATHTSIIATDPQGVITTFNKGAEILFGYSAEDVVGRSRLDLLHLPDDIAARGRALSAQCGRPIEGFQVLVEQARQGGHEERDWVYLTKHGERRIVSLTMTALKNDAEAVIGYLEIGKDITRRKAAEAALAAAARELTHNNADLAQARDEALQAVQLKADFLATMSHEIRTPMNAIIGMTGLLLDTPLTEPQREFAEIVRRSGDGLLTLVNDILDFSKIEAGTLRFDEIGFDLRATVEDALDLLAEQAQRKGLELVGLIMADVPDRRRGDPGRLRQILINLLGNAIKFSETGEIVLRVARDPDAPDRLRWSVTDSGIGIASEAQPRLFQPFVQADSSTTRRYGGTGLGLAICRRLVTQMHGEIGVDSRLGEGSTFWFTARLLLADDAAPAPSAWNRLRGRRVLLVGRRNTVSQAIEQQLAPYGVTCVKVEQDESATDVLRAATRQPVDLVLIDLPASDAEARGDARRWAPLLGNPRLKVVLLTAVGRRDRPSPGETDGADACLTKPLRHGPLLDCLSLLIGDRSEQVPAAPAPPAPAPEPPASNVAPTSSPVRLLLVEDNVVNQKVACKMLEKLGCLVDVAPDGRAAVTAHQRTPYPLIFMDCHMPEMDGFEATAQIRRLEGETAHTPIIAMTANAMSGDREHCLAAEMDDYVSKPIRRADLQAVLHRWMPQHVPQAAA